MLTIDQSARIIDPTAQALRALRSEAEEAAEAAEIRYVMVPGDAHDTVDAAATVEFIREVLAEYVVRGGDPLALWDKCATFRASARDLNAWRSRLVPRVACEQMAA